MDTSNKQQDPNLDKFDKWLKSSKIQPPKNRAALVRARIDEAPADLDDLLDEMLRQDPRMRNPQMILNVRNELEGADAANTGSHVWFKWLTPLAAAATLTFALVSFQSRAPHVSSPAIVAVEAQAAENFGPQLDSEVTQIFALAVNLKGDTDVTTLESVEDLAFLFN